VRVQARKAEAHWYYCDARFVIELLAGHTHPLPQPIAGWIGKGYTGLMDARAGSLTHHGETGRSADANHGARLVGKRLSSRMIDAGPAGPKLIEEGFEALACRSRTFAG
jgi:hypothetical protein